jgi:Calcium binding
MARPRRRSEEHEREDRIAFEIIVDAYNETERGWSWYYYLETQLEFPFKARSFKPGTTWSQSTGEEIQVLSMAPQDSDIPEIEVLVQVGRRKLTVRLEELSCAEAGTESCQALEDWRYWVDRDYRF